MINLDCRIELLDGLRVQQGDRAITRFSTRKTAALLAYLAYYPQHPHSRELLIEMLWPDCTPEAGRNRLSVALSSLRRQLEPTGNRTLLQTDYASVQLNAIAFTTDVAAFETALQAAYRTDNQAERFRFLSEAISLYSGALLPGYYEDWLLFERERLADRFFQATRLLIAHLQNLRELELALEYARRAVRVDPLREEAHAEVLRLLVALGQTAEARHHFQELEALLHKELGMAPSEATYRLIREIDTRDPPPAKHLILNPEPDRVDPVRSLVPTGTVTFLLLDKSDLQAPSPTLPDREPDRSRERERVRKRLGDRMRRLGGHLLQTSDDVAFTVAFPRPSDALDAAVATQSREDNREDNLVSEERTGDWRMALHTGEVKPKEAPRHETALDLAARMLTAAQPGQILCSEETARLLSRGLEPGLNLLDLGLYRLQELTPPERLYSVHYPQMPPTAYAAPKASSATTGNLPRFLTRFFGREAEIDHLQTRLLSDETRLLTLSGPGGGGKTRLAVEVARRLLEPRQGAVWFVALADLSDAGLIMEAIRDVLGITHSPHIETLEQVVALLSRQPSLLVLDNFEHLVEEGAELVSLLLERVGTLACLVTSRRCLSIAGEEEYVIPPLPIPDVQSSPERLSRFASVELFVDRAQAVRPDFQITKANARAVARVCDRLEGLPLALVLAASRIRVMSPAQMLSELANRLNFLVSRHRTMVTRHQTLRTAIDWSYRLLTPDLQDLFARLWVFSGGCTLEAVEAVCGQAQTLEKLSQLRECSLIAVEERGEEIRFRMLETLREYASEQLTAEERAALAQRHVGYYLNLAEESDRRYISHEQMRWLGRLQSEHENLRAALDWCARPEADPHEESGLLLARYLRPFWARCGYIYEGRQYLSTLLAHHRSAQQTVARAWAIYTAAGLAEADGDLISAQALFDEVVPIWRELAEPVGLAEALKWQAWVTFSQGDYATARVHYEESMAIFREAEYRPGLAEALVGLGWIAFVHGDYATARALDEESLAIYRDLGASGYIAGRLAALGRIATAQGDYSQARACYEECLAIRQASVDRVGIVGALYNLGYLTYRQGDYATSGALYTDALTRCREIGYHMFEAYILHDQGLLAVAQGNYAQARTCYIESLVFKREIGDIMAFIQTLEAVAELAAAHQQWKSAATLSAAAAAQREGLGAPVPPDLSRAHDRHLAAVQSALGEEEFQTAWEEGSALTMELALDFARHLL